MLHDAIGTFQMNYKAAQRRARARSLKNMECAEREVLNRAYLEAVRKVTKLESATWTAEQKASVIAAAKEALAALNRHRKEHGC